MFGMGKAKQKRNSSPRNWPEQLKEMKDLDTLLRCPICFDYLNITMILPACSHNFCSLCIRKYLTFKKQCPVCATHATDSILKNNRLLDDIIEKFKKIQTAVAKSGSSSLLVKLEGSSANCLATEDLECTPEVQRKKRKAASTVKKPLKTIKHFYGSGKKTGTKEPSKPKPPESDDDIFILEDSNEYFKPPAKKIKKAPPVGIVKPLDFDGVDDDDFVHNKTRQTPMTIDTRKQDMMIGDHGNQLLMDTEIVDLHFGLSNALPETAPCIDQRDTTPPRPPVMEDPHVSGSPFAGLKTPKGKSLLNNKGKAPKVKTLQKQTKASDNSDGEKKFTPVVPCPVCGLDIRENFINNHLDMCLSSSDKKEALRKRRAPEKRKAMPKLVYALLSDKELKKRLKDVGLSVKAERHILIKKHNELTLIYNSQCDSLNPKSAEEIVREIENNEMLKTELSTSQDNSERLQLQKGAKLQDVEAAQKKYVKQHKTQFKDLVQQARLKVKAISAKRKPVHHREANEEENNEASVDIGCRNTEVENLDEEVCSNNGDDTTANISIDVENPVLNITEGAIRNNDSISSSKRAIDENPDYNMDSAQHENATMVINLAEDSNVEMIETAGDNSESIKHTSRPEASTNESSESGVEISRQSLGGDVMMDECGDKNTDTGVDKHKLDGESVVDKGQITVVEAEQTPIGEVGETCKELSSTMLSQRSNDLFQDISPDKKNTQNGKRTYGSPCVTSTSDLHLCVQEGDGTGAGADIQPSTSGYSTVPDDVSDSWPPLSQIRFRDPSPRSTGSDTSSPLICYLDLPDDDKGDGVLSEGIRWSRPASAMSGQSDVSSTIMDWNKGTQRVKVEDLDTEQPKKRKRKKIKK